MRLAIDKARRYGLGAASYTHVHHIGRLGEYVSTAAAEGLIGIMFANGSRRVGWSPRSALANVFYRPIP